MSDKTIPILSITDLVICKVIFNREKDWMDIAKVRVHPMLDWNLVKLWTTEICGSESLQVVSLNNYLAKSKNLEQIEFDKLKDANLLMHPRKVD